MIELTQQQRQELSAPEPIALDHHTGASYVLARRETYERLKILLALDDYDWEESRGNERKARYVMTFRETRYSREEFARRGQEIYEQQIRPFLRAEDADKFVAIDIESGDYEIDREDYTATEHLLRRRPEAQIWLVRVGQPAAYHLGALPACGEKE
jgi:hypothetical protein